MYIVFVCLFKLFVCIFFNFLLPLVVNKDVHKASRDLSATAEILVTIQSESFSLYCPAVNTS